jgi:hypothetical protein
MKKLLGAVVFCAAALVAPLANAAMITTLYNTGVNNSGVPLANGTTPDPHYSLTVVPTGSSTVTRVIDQTGGFPIGPYFVGGNLSRWIVPNNNSTAGNAAGDTAPVGDYIFRTTFDLTGFDFASAAITGGWSTDNAGLDIRLNGVSKGFSHGSNFSVGFFAFSLTSGFQAGINTIDFVVNNAAGGGNNPVALRVEMTGTANQIPEPEGLALVGMALFAAGVARRRAVR